MSTWKSTYLKYVLISTIFQVLMKIDQYAKDTLLDQSACILVELINLQQKKILGEGCSFFFSTNNHLDECVYYPEAKENFCPFFEYPML